MYTISIGSIQSFLDFLELLATPFLSHSRCKPRLLLLLFLFMPLSWKSCSLCQSDHIQYFCCVDSRPDISQLITVVGLCVPVVYMLGDESSFMTGANLTGDGEHRFWYTCTKRHLELGSSGCKCYNQIAFHRSKG